MPAEKGRILIIDDEEVIRDACTQTLTRSGHVVKAVENGELGLKQVQEFDPDLILIDLKMPGKSGMEVLEELANTHSELIKIVITGYSTVSSAVEAMKRGAYDFIPKPFTPEEIRLIVERGLERRRLLLEREALRREQEAIRRNMISLVSHELRAPLAATIQYLEVILAGMAGDVSEEAREMIERCKIRAREMLELFSRWLNLATFDPQRTTERFENVSLHEIATISIELLTPLAEQKKVSLILESPDNLPPIKGNKGSLEEIFNNLISNAVKYNKQGGWAKATLFAEDEEVCFEVSDSGAGIPKEHLPRIFDEFYRVDGRRNAPIKGAGLGLAIVKKLVDAHGGTIGVESTFGEGTTFRVIFPRDHRPQDEE